MTLNDLECPIHLKVRLVDGTLDVRLLRVLDSTMRIGVARVGEASKGEWAGGPSPLPSPKPPCAQLTRCFSAVAELLVVYFDKGAFQPFKVIQGHCRWCQSKACMRLPISP